MKSQLELRLRRYATVDLRIQNLRDALEEARAVAESARTATLDRVGGSGTTDPHSLESRVARIDAIEAALKAEIIEKELLARNLDDLPFNERRCLEVLVIQHRRGGIYDLADELGYSEPQLYRIRRAALDHLEMRLFGRKL